MNALNATTAKPLSGLRVLVTRAVEDNHRLRAELARLGAVVIALPTIERAPPEDWGPADAALKALGEYHWVVFTSAHAVIEVFRRLGSAARTGLPSGLRVAAIGPATLQALEKQHVVVHLTAQEAHAGGLATALAPSLTAGHRVLLPGSDLARPDLRLALERAGASVDAIVVYRTIQAAVDAESLGILQRGEIDVVVLASPSGLHNLVDMLGGSTDPLRVVSLVCIGPTTATAVTSLGLSVDAVAEPHTDEGIVQAIVQLVQGDTVHEQES